MRYRVRSPHFMKNERGEDCYLEAGTEIGDGTIFPAPAKPSIEMEALDDEAEALVAERQRTFCKIEVVAPTNSGAYVSPPVVGRI